MAKAELGKKRQCRSCGSRFYDLAKEQPACPSCGAVIEAEATAKGGGKRSRKGQQAASTAAPAAPAAVAEPEAEASELEPEAEAAGEEEPFEEDTGGEADEAEEDVLAEEPALGGEQDLTEVVSDEDSSQS